MAILKESDENVLRTKNFRFFFENFYYQLFRAASNVSI